jgi:hypothetical protein
VPAFSIGRYFVIWGEEYLRSMARTYSSGRRPIPILRYTQLIIDFHLSSAHGFPPSRRIGAMVSLVDGSKATTPAPGGRTEVSREDVRSTALGQSVSATRADVVLTRLTGGRYRAAPQSRRAADGRRSAGR